MGGSSKKKDKSDKKRTRSGNSGQTPEDKKVNRRLISEEFEEDICRKEEKSSNMEGLEQALEQVRKHLSDQISGVIKSVDFISNSIDELRKELKQTQVELKKTQMLEQEILVLKSQNRAIKQKVLDMENYSRKDNMLISGIEEKENEDCRNLSKQFFKDRLKIKKDIELVRCHRLGKPGTSRPLIIRFRLYEDRELVKRQQRLLKDTGIFLNDDLCNESKHRRDSLIPVLKEMKKVDIKAHMRGEKLFSNGRLYTAENIHELPIDAHNACTKSEKGVTIFSGRFSRLSNLHPCSLDINGRSWKSSEHIYQYEKSQAAKSPEIASLIIATDDPVEVMYIGKSINVNNAQWLDRSQQIMSIALEAKFNIPQFKLALQKSEEIIGEGTRHPIWGIGHNMSYKEAFDRTKWAGQNKLGEMLMLLKKKIIKV